jgi:hypothetical protein
MTAPHATPRARAKLPQLEPAARRLDTVGRGLEHWCSVNACRASSSGPVATNEQKAHRSTTLASGNITMPPKFVHRRSSDLLNGYGSRQASTGISEPTASASGHRGLTACKP